VYVEGRVHDGKVGKLGKQKGCTASAEANIYTAVTAAAGGKTDRPSAKRVCVLRNASDQPPRLARGKVEDDAQDADEVRAHLLVLEELEDDVSEVLA
jgi:hypothetical protein